MTPYYIKLRVTDKGDKSTTYSVCEIMNKLQQLRHCKVTLEAIEDEEDQQ